MPILHSLLAELKAEFTRSEKGKERSVWFRRSRYDGVIAEEPTITTSFRRL
jgi:hypothetical protein